ncbi:GNAT family N-acetyltransferase [Marimonas lutisalis]|uniref:GNAT family N-acetyltransferase n=1 Tax=Marimonas lutisalis TaxID=2545756 RepID=UPI00137567CC|nr:GNAT family N-acetyltransferase [Marimonas lutisalis]
MSGGLTIRPARESDAGAIADMLGKLADYLGDGEAFSTTPETVRRHGFGDGAAFGVLIAEAGGAMQGMALYFRHFSTTRGQAGVYVQDLWIEPQARGQRLGEDLLRAVARVAGAGWGAAYLMLTVHRDNPDALRFYERLGFHAHDNDLPMVLGAGAFRALAGAEAA